MFFLVDVTTERLKDLACLPEEGAVTVEVGRLPLACLRLARPGQEIGALGPLGTGATQF
jgi:hypothetical protein